MGADEAITEQERIRRVYQHWLGEARINAYAWHRPENLAQSAARMRVSAALLADTVGTDLSELDIIDVGCGSGTFLRQLVNWGADPHRLIGTEYQQQRLDLAALRSPPSMRWHLGDLHVVGSGTLDLIVANTVFSSVLDAAARATLAEAMWRVLRPGGWCMVFDFRYNNPRNANVRRVRRAELVQMWPGTQGRYRTLLLAPPLARRLSRAPRLLSELLHALLPPLRSHFIFMVQKPR